MTPLLEAIDIARKEGRLAAVVDLLESGYQPDESEWEELRHVFVHKRTGQKEKTKRGLDRRKAAILRYRELVAEDMDCKRAIEQVATEFDLHTSTIADLVNGRDPRLPLRSIP
jgi:hypothetical protein